MLKFALIQLTLIQILLTGLHRFYYPAVRTGSSNTRFFFVCLFVFCGGSHLPQTSGFCLAKQIVVASFATQVRARILSGRNIFCTLGEGQQRWGLMPLGLFLLISNWENVFKIQDNSSLVVICLILMTCMSYNTLI